jgi:hypothetical protein
MIDTVEEVNRFEIDEQEYAYFLGSIPAGF